MKNYCTKCCMNWAGLLQLDDDQLNEQYDVCPQCKNDFFLTDFKADQPGFVFKVFEGILNIETGEPYIKPAPARYYKPEPAPFDIEAWKAKKEKEEQAIEARLDAYHAALAAGKSIAEAEAIYFNKIS